VIISIVDRPTPTVKWYSSCPVQISYDKLIAILFGYRRERGTIARFVVSVWQKAKGQRRDLFIRL